MPRGRADPVVKERLEALEDRMPKLHSPWKRQVKYWKFQNHRKGFGQGFWIVLDRSFTRIHFSYCRGCLLIYCCCVYSQIWFILDSTWLKTHLSFQHTVCQYTHQTRRFVDPIFWDSSIQFFDCRIFRLAKATVHPTQHMPHFLLSGTAADDEGVSAKASLQHGTCKPRTYWNQVESRINQGK